jgi:hypothetical protein
MLLSIGANSTRIATLSLAKRGGRVEKNYFLQSRRAWWESSK